MANVKDPNFRGTGKPENHDTVSLVAIGPDGLPILLTADNTGKLNTSGSGGGGGGDASAANQTAQISRLDSLLSRLPANLDSNSGGLLVGESDSLEQSAVSTTSASTLFTQDMKLFRSACIQVTSAGTSNVIAFEVSNDAVNWVAATSYQPLNTGSTIPSTTTGAAGIYRIGVTERWFRVRVSTYSSGTVTAQAIYRSESQRPLGVYIAGAATLTARLQTSTSADGFTASQTYIMPATPAVTSLTGAANAWQGIDIVNLNTTLWRHVKIWNTASASITLGTTAALLSFGIPPGQARFLPFPIYLRFATALCFATTGGIALNDNTAISANEVAVTFVR